MHPSDGAVAVDPPKDRLGEAMSAESKKAERRHAEKCIPIGLLLNNFQSASETSCVSAVCISGSDQQEQADSRNDDTTRNISGCPEHCDEPALLLFKCESFAKFGANYGNTQTNATAYCGYTYKVDNNRSERIRKETRGPAPFRFLNNARKVLRSPRINFPSFRMTLT